MTYMSGLSASRHPTVSRTKPKAGIAGAEPVGTIPRWSVDASLKPLTISGGQLMLFSL